MTTRCGLVSIVGKPNVGKSSLLNALAGRKVSIVSSKPGTTRHRIHVAVTRAKIQALFVDTPGLFMPKVELDRVMEKMVVRAVEGVDVVLFISDDRGVQELDNRMLTTIRLRAPEAPVVLVLNKIDRVNGAGKIEALVASWKDVYPWAGVTLLSVQRKRGLDKVWAAMSVLLPEREFEVAEADAEEMEMDDKLFVADLVREQALRLLQQEVPHAMAVVVNQFEEVKGVLRIQVDLVVERETQKKIVVGAGGSMVREIGMRARAELERKFEGKIYLELFVKVRAGWRNDPSRLKEYGYSD